MLYLEFNGENDLLNNKYKGELLSRYTYSVFLAGPTRRNSPFSKSWRHEAVKIIKQNDFIEDSDLKVYIPECRNDNDIFDSSIEGLHRQHIWEWEHLKDASYILFWIPRNVEDGMPAFTTNIEFGYWIAYDNERVILGYPKDAEKMDYIDDLYQEFGAEYGRGYVIKHTLEDTIGVLFDLIHRACDRRPNYIHPYISTHWENFD